VGFQGCPLFLCPGCLTGKKIVQSNLQNEKQLKNCRPSGSEDTNPSGSEIRRRESCFFIEKKITHLGAANIFPSNLIFFVNLLGE